MLALSVFPPYASLIVAGEKRMEVRDWTFPGKLPRLIALYQTTILPEEQVKEFSPRTPAGEGLRRIGYSSIYLVPRGAIVGLGIVVASGNYTDYTAGKLKGAVWGREVFQYLDPNAPQYGWLFGPTVRFKNPLRTHGNRGLWTWQAPPEVDKIAADLWQRFLAQKKTA